MFVAYVAIVIHPTADQMRNALPANLGDPALIVWILRWGGHALVTSPRHYFNAGIFWPHRAALAYSDPLTPLVPAYGLFFALTGSWAFALNLTLLSLILLNLGSTYALTRYLTRRTDAGVVAALGFAGGAYAQAHFGHIQLQTMGFIPLALLLVFKLLDERKLGTAIVLGFVNAALVLSALYYGAIYAVCVVVIVVSYVALHRFRPGPGLLLPLAVTAVISGLLLAPAAVSYLAAQHDQHLVRGLEPGYGLNPIDLVTPALGSSLFEEIHRSSAPDNVEHRFFPGLVTPVLALAGLTSLVMRWRRRKTTDPDVDEKNETTVSSDGPRPDLLFLLLLAGLAAVLLALGPTVAGVPAPYRFFHDYVPGFAGIRVTSRLAVVTLLAGAVLAGWGWMRVSEKLVPDRGGRWWRAGLTALVVCALVAEGYADRPWANLPSDTATVGVYRLLSHRPTGPTVELPMADPRTQGVAWPFVESPRMVYATIDWMPRVNGYSGFIPPDYLIDIVAFNQFPSPIALERARALSVRYVILHTGTENGYPAFDESRIRAILTRLPPGSRAFHRGHSWLVDLGPRISERR